MTGGRRSLRVGRRELGDGCLILGAILLVAGAPLTPPWMSAGMILAGLGWLLSLPPPGARWALVAGLGVTALIAAAGLATWFDLDRPVKFAQYQVAWVAMFFTRIGLADPRWRRAALMALLVTVGAATLLACLQYVIGYEPKLRPWRIDTGGQRQWEMASGFAPHTITFGFIAGLVVILFVCDRTLGPTLRITAIILGALCLAMSGCRGALLGLLAALAIIVLSSKDRAAWWLAGLVTMVAVMITWVAWRQPARIAELLAGKNDRWLIWAAAFDAITQRPWTGHGGLDGYRQAIAGVDFRALSGPMTSPNPHNSWLALAAFHGAPVAAAHLALLGAVLLEVRRTAVALALPLALIAYWLVAGCFQSLAAHALPSLAFFAFLGLAWPTRSGGEGSLPVPDLR